MAWVQVELPGVVIEVGALVRKIILMRLQFPACSKYPVPKRALAMRVFARDVGPEATLCAELTTFGCSRRDSPTCEHFH